MPYAVQREVRDGQLVRLSLGIDLVDDYLEFLRCQARPNTWLNYAHDLKVFFSIVDKPVPDVTTADVFRFMEHQHRPRPAEPDAAPPHGVCARTLKRRLCAVSNLYTYLLTRGDTAIAQNPVPAGLPVRGHALGTPRRATPLLRTPQTLPDLVPTAQIQRFLASLSTYRDKAMILLMVLGGLRKSEVLGVELADLDPVRGTVLVRQGKGGRQRLCCVAPLFFTAVDRYRRTERPPAQTVRLFVVLKGPQRGQPLSVSGLNTIIAHHRRVADTPALTCHRLRHTCLTLLREAGMSLEALQQQAGHCNINTTRVYLHLSNQALRDEYFRVADQLFTSTTAEVDHA
ncbi:MAG TPA: tyrosine-type recombinase/integrase [Chloroflexota bacterium]|nr:tyrosine-type recombinase/integrase [Chloroflexota bacterium]